MARKLQVAADLSGLGGAVKYVNGVSPDSSGNVSITIDVTEDVETALTAAKESGEFDGPQGPSGKDGSDANVTAANIKLALGYVPADSEEVGRLSSQFPDKIGYIDLDNTIILDNADPGEYTVRPENWSVPLDGYDPIGMTVTADAKEYLHLIPENCAPVGTKKLGVYDSSGSKVGNIRPHSNYCRRTGEKLYSFMVLSDVHLPYDTAAVDFDRALTYADSDDDIKFVTISGDLSKAGSIEELQDFRAAVDSHATPVWPATGNHEGANANIRFVVEQYVGLPLYYKKEYGDDVYLFVGCKSNTTGALFTKAELQWLYEELELNRNKRCFVFQHVRPEDGCGNALGIYTNDIWGGTEQVVFESLMRHYKNVILFHGHSHLKLYMQEFSDIANYDNLFGCHSVHVPSLAVPRDTTSVVDPSITEVYADSEGYVVDVYDKGIMLRGRDFIAEKFLPIATYWLDTPLHEVPAQTYSDPTGTLDTSIVREINLAWTLDTDIDNDTGEEIVAAFSATSDPIPVSRTLWYRANYQDYDRQSDVVVHSYAADGAYIGYDYLYLYNKGRIPDICFIPHEGAATFRIAVDNLANAPVHDKIRKISIKAVPSDKYTNLIPLSTEQDGTPYNGGQGWKEGYYANSTGGETARTKSKVTGYIPYTDGQVICVSGFDFINDTHARVTCYDENFAVLWYVDIKGERSLSKWNYSVALDRNKCLITFCPYSIAWKHPDGTIKYIRISAETMTKESIVTLDEPLAWSMESVPVTWEHGIKIDEATGVESSDTSYTASEMITFDTDAFYEVSLTSSHQLGLSYIWYDADGTFLGCTQSVRKTTDESNAFAMTEVLEPPAKTASMKIRVSHGGYWTADEVGEKVKVVRKY